MSGHSDNIPVYTASPDVLGLWAVRENGVTIGAFTTEAAAKAVAQALTFYRRALALAPKLVALVARTWERVN